jgi:S1-C subfamily serine protease
MVQPFAIVQNVEPNSPADEGGMKMGDKLVKFGDAQGPAGLTVLQSRLSVWVLQRAGEISV